MTKKSYTNRSAFDAVAWITKNIRTARTDEEATVYLKSALRNFAFGELVCTSPLSKAVGHPHSADEWRDWFHQNKPDSGEIND